jgi:hypothetical protein
MEILPIDVFGVHVDVPFPAPLAFQQARIEEFGAKICDPAKGLSLRPDQIRLRRFDDLYDYSLTAQFFGENGTLTRTADRVKFGVRNARTAADWKIIRDLLVRFYVLLDAAPASISTLSTHAHAKFPSAEERDAWVARFSYSPLISRAASLGHVQITGWDKEVRVLIERSNAVPDAVFVMWDTQFENSQDWETYIDKLPVMMEDSANLFDLGFEPFRERV